LGRCIETRQEERGKHHVYGGSTAVFRARYGVRVGTQNVMIPKSTACDHYTMVVLTPLLTHSERFTQKHWATTSWSRQIVAPEWIASSSPVGHPIICRIDY
jgi:hypothetical protein